jgi:hypothetical protein
MSRIRKNRKNQSRKLKQIQPQQGGGTPSEIREAFWVVRDHYLDYSKLTTGDFPDYTNLIDMSRAQTDFGLPQVAAFLDVYSQFSVNYTIVKNAWLVNHINLPTQDAAIDTIKLQIDKLYADCQVQKQATYLAASSLNAYITGNSATWLGMSDDWRNWYANFYTVSKTLIPDATYNQWKSSGSSTYPTNTPTDAAIDAATVVVNGIATPMPIKYYVDSYLLGYNGAAKFVVSRVTAYNAFLKYVATTPVAEKIAAINADITAGKELVVQSKVVAAQVEIELYKWQKALMGIVVFPEYNNKTVLFMSAPMNNFIYMDLETYMIYLTDFNTVQKSQVMTDLVKGCLEFRDKLAVVGTTAAVITALPNNSLVKALALKGIITEKIASIQLTDIVPPPPPPAPSFTGYGKWKDAASQAAASSGKGIIIVVDSSGNNVLLNGQIWYINNVWNITFNGVARSYFISGDGTTNTTVTILP